MPSHAHEAVPEDVFAETSSELLQSLVADREHTDATADRHRLCAALVSAYGGDAYRLLTDLPDLLEASVAYVDRPTVEAHLERPLSDTEWSAIASRYTAMAFDEHIRDAGTIRTDWIDDVLLRAGLPGRPRGDSRPPNPPRHRAGDEDHPHLLELRLHRRLRSAPLADAHHPRHSCARHRRALERAIRRADRARQGGRTRSDEGSRNGHQR